MLMSDLRSMAKKNRGVMLAVVGILCIGLLSSYAMLGSSSGQSNSLKSQISAYEKAVDNAKKELAAKPDDYSQNLNLGDLLYELASLYAEDGNAKFSQAMADAAVYYDAAYKNATGLSDEGKAGILVKRANALYASGDSINAELTLMTAVYLAPTNWSANYNYIVFLLLEKGAERALEYALEYKDILAADDPNLSSLNIIIDDLKSRVESENDHDHS